MVDLFCMSLQQPRLLGNLIIAPSGLQVALEYVSMEGGSPSILLDFLPGKPADRVLAATDAAVIERLSGQSL